MIILLGSRAPLAPLAARAPLAPLAGPPPEGGAAEAGRPREAQALRPREHGIFFSLVKQVISYLIFKFQYDVKPRMS